MTYRSKLLLLLPKQSTLPSDFILFSDQTTERLVPLQKHTIEFFLTLTECEVHRPPIPTPGNGVIRLLSSQKVSEGYCAKIK